MKTHKLLLALLLLMLFAINCSDDDKEIPVPEEPEEIIEEEEKEEEEEEVGFGLDCEVKTITFKPRERLEFETNSNGDIITLRYFFNNSVDEVITFTYTEGKLVSGTSFFGAKINVEYVEDRITTVIFGFTGDNDIDEHRFFYEEGKISRIESWDNYSGEEEQSWTLLATENFELTDGNITKYSSVESVSDTFQADISYDDKKNALQNALAYYVWDLDALAFFSTNNPVKIDAVIGDGNSKVEYNQTVDYIYNNSDYPKSRVYTDSEQESYTEKFSYVCEQP